MIRQVLAIAPLALIAASAAAQAHNPVAWSVASAPHSGVKPGAKFDIAVTGKPEPGWHLYAMQEPDGGPIATEVGIAEGDPASLLHVTASKPQTMHDPALNLDTGVYVSAAQFTLHLQAASAPSPGPIRVLVRYQSCNNNVCLPPRTQTIPVPVHIGQ